MGSPTKIIPTISRKMSSLLSLSNPGGYSAELSGEEDSGTESLLSTAPSKQESQPNRKTFDPSKLSEFEYEKLMKLFKQKAAVAYLVSVGCTTHQSLKDMVQYVMENEEPPPFKPIDKFSHRALHKKNLEQQEKKASPTKVKLILDERKPSAEKVNQNSKGKGTCHPIEVRNDVIHAQKKFSGDESSLALNRAKSKMQSFYGFAQNLVLKKEFTRRDLREKKTKGPKVVKKEELKNKVLLPPIDEAARKRYAEKVRKSFEVKISAKDLETPQQRRDYREKCRQNDKEWRQYIDEWSLYFPIPRLSNLRYKTIKYLENSHMAPGMYDRTEYEDSQLAKKIQIKRGFNTGGPRFVDNDEFSQVTPWSYGDGVFKYEMYMRNTGIVKHSNLPQEPRFAYYNNHKECTASAAEYKIPNSIDSLLKSKKGAYYPKNGIPMPKRHPRSYIAEGRFATLKEVQPRTQKEDNILKNMIKREEEAAAVKPLPGMFTDLQNRNNKTKGKFKALIPQISHFYDKALEVTPGPGHYEIAKDPSVQLTKAEVVRRQERAKLKKAHKAKADMYSVDYMPTKDFCVLAEVYNSEDIGPGYYTMTRSPRNLNGFTSRFKKGVPQRLPAAKWKVLDERLRGKDVPLQEKLELASR